MNADFGNYNNADFYDHLPLSTWHEFAAKSGLNSGYDLDIIDEYIKKATSILEVGAGYGRVIDLLLKRGYQGKITAIERCPKLCSILRERFGNRIELHEIDVKNFVSAEKYDLILWLWTGISEFNKHEQKEMCQYLTKYMTNNFVIDTITYSSEKMIYNNPVQFLGKKIYFIMLNGSVIYGYMPSPKEMFNYIKELKINMSHVVYETATNLKRNTFTLCKSFSN